MSVLEQQMAALQVELAQSQQHVARLATALDELRTSSSDAITNLSRIMQEGTGKGVEKKKQMIYMKHVDPQKFAGRDNENYKEWAKHVKNFLNAQQRGFRKALGVVGGAGA